jgi:hypothetical protein
VLYCYILLCITAIGRNKKKKNPTGLLASFCRPLSELSPISRNGCNACTHANSPPAHASPPRLPGLCILFLGCHIILARPLVIQRPHHYHHSSLSSRLSHSSSEQLSTPCRTKRKSTHVLSLRRRFHGHTFITLPTRSLPHLMHSHTNFRAFVTLLLRQSVRSVFNAPHLCP